MYHPIQISPSILSADFLNLGRDIRLIEEAGTDMIHVDVMDGHFVPNLTIGPPHVKALAKMTDVPLDVHLMIANPEKQLPWYIDAGASIVTVHIETLSDPLSTIAAIHEAGCRCGITLNPPTPATAVRACIPFVDMVLVMSVNPGFSGQSFIPSAVDKVAAIAAWAAEDGVDPLIEVDGGISKTTAPLVVAAGADVLVAGNAIFATDDPARALRELRIVAGEAQATRERV